MKSKKLQQEKIRLKKVADWYDPSTRRIEFMMINYRADIMMFRIKGPKVLEMGCSTGVMTKKLVKKFPDLTVIDASKRYIDYTKKILKSKRAKFIVSLFEEFKTKEKFDDIIMAHILEHVKDSVSILKKAKSWLKENGKIHIIVPNARSLHRRVGQKMGIIKKLDDFSKLDRKIGHRRVYTKEKLRKDVRKAGMKVVSEYGIFLKFLSQAQISNWNKKILDAFFEIGKELPIDYCSALYFICKKK